MTIRLLTVLAALTMIPIASAQCPDPANLVTNCGFEVNDDNWSAIKADSMVRSTAEARTGVGSLLGDALWTPVDWKLTVETCVDVTPSTDYGAGVWARLLVGSDVDCHVWINSFREESCSDHAYGWDSSWTAVGTAMWSETAYDFSNGTTIESVGLDIECSSVTGDFQLYLDDAYLGVGLGPLLFADGFESGDTGAWAP